MVFNPWEREEREEKEEEREEERGEEGGLRHTDPCNVGLTPNLVVACMLGLAWAASAAATASSA